MMAQPFFTVIVPMYNAVNTIKRTVDSVLDQVFNNYELILIDDGSSDGTIELVRGFIDERIIFVGISNSGGPAGPRNVGLKLARGEWVCFLDADDLWEPSKLQVVHDSIRRQPGVDLWTSGYYIFDKDGIGGRRLPSILVDNFSTESLLIYSSPFVTSALVVRRDKLGDLTFDQSIFLSSVEDLDFLLKLAQKSLKAGRIDQILVGYLLNDKGISKNFERHLMNLGHLHRKYMAMYEGGLSKIVFKVRVRSNFYWILAISRFSCKRYLSFILLLALSVLMSPVDRFYYFFVFSSWRRNRRFLNYKDYFK